MGATTATIRVFVLEPVKQRLDNAARFGTIAYIFPPDSARCSIFDTEDLSDEIITTLKTQSYNPETDYIVITGHQIPVVTMVAALANEYGKFKALLYNAVEHGYIERLLG